MTEFTHVVTALNLDTNEVVEEFFSDVYEAQERCEYLTYTPGYAEVSVRATGMLAHKSQLLHDGHA